MILHFAIGPEQLRRLIRKRKIVLAGNARLKIYGQLRCRSGMRMNKRNRVFFAAVDDAILMGYRPCGRCLHQDYNKWRGSRSS